MQGAGRLVAVAQELPELDHQAEQGGADVGAALVEGAPGPASRCMDRLRLLLCLLAGQPIAERAKAIVAPKAAPPASAAVASGFPEA